MIAWKCEICGAESKQNLLPESCPLCKRKNAMSQIEVVDPTEDDIFHTQKFEEAIKMMKTYEEDTIPVTKIEGCECCHASEKKSNA